MFERYLTPLEEIVRNRDGDGRVQGRVGITHAPFVPLVGVIDAELAGREQAPGCAPAI